MGMNVSKILLSVGAGGAATLLIYSLLSGDRKPARKTPILGLRNCGNSCFLNAILQAIASCRFVKGWLRQKDADINYGLPKPVQVIESFSGVQYPLIAAMFRAVLIMNRELVVDDSLYSSKVPGDVLAGLRFHGHRLGVQQEQDAYEVFLLIASALNYEVELSVRRKQMGSMGVLTDGRVMKEDPLPWSESEEVIPPVDLSPEYGDWAVIGDPGTYRVTDRIYSKRQVEMRMNYKSSPKSPFRCLMFTQMQCLVCMTKSNVRLEASDTLTLSLPPADTSVGLNVHDLLLRFMRPSMVHNVDCDNCTSKALRNTGYFPAGGDQQHQRIKSTFFRYNYIAKLPNSLCIHIPRCVWGPRGVLKRTEFVAFPERINLGLLKRLYDGGPPDFDGKADAHKIFTREPDHGNEGKLRRFRNSEYHLTAVISHFGFDVDSGHFVTFRKIASAKDPDMVAWYYISDDVVQSVPVSSVMGTRAYMLFYEKTYIKE